MYREKADKIANYKTYSDKQKVDALLELNATIYTNLGLDSTKQEIKTAEVSSRHIYRHIKTIDDDFGRLLLRDSKQG
tara:strand:+ start:178 stop:408 length:231 start_codon:yes stop_codon:yes gene_type:complete